jgi:hypothetical protein
MPFYDKNALISISGKNRKKTDFRPFLSENERISTKRGQNTGKPRRTRRARRRSIVDKLIS